MAAHNAIIYVYCDFNLRLPHADRPKIGPKQSSCARERCTFIGKECNVCNELTRITKSMNLFRYHEEN